MLLSELQILYHLPLFWHLTMVEIMEAQLPETEAAVTEIRVDTEAIRVVPWQEVLKQEMSDRLK